MVINDNDIENVACFDVGDIALQVKTFNDKKIHEKNMHPLAWIFVDVITYSNEDDSSLVAQIKPSREVPFDINEPKFVNAFKKIFNSSTERDYIIDEQCNVRKSFWERVLKQMDKK